MKKVYIYSTLSNDQVYQVEGGGVFVAGKANVSNKHFLTPKGVVTGITEEQYELLKKNRVFQKHQANGFLVSTLSDIDPETVARDMAGPDGSAQDTDATLASLAASNTGRERNPAIRKKRLR